MSHENKENSDDGTLTYLDRIVAKVGRIVSLLFLVSCAIIVYEVLARYLFNAPTKWAHETTTFICALCFVYGGAQCMARNKHIRIVIFYQGADNSAKRILNIFISILVIILCCMLTYAAWSMVQNAFYAPDGSFRIETSGSAWDPIFPALVKLALFLGLLLMTVQSISQLVHHCRRTPDA